MGSIERQRMHDRPLSLSSALSDQTTTKKNTRITSVAIE